MSSMIAKASIGYGMNVQLIRGHYTSTCFGAPVPAFARGSVLADNKVSESATPPRPAGAPGSIQGTADVPSAAEVHRKEQRREDQQARREVERTRSSSRCAFSPAAKLLPGPLATLV